MIDDFGVSSIDFNLRGLGHWSNHELEDWDDSASGFDFLLEERDNPLSEEQNSAPPIPPQSFTQSFATRQGPYTDQRCRRPNVAFAPELIGEPCSPDRPAWSSVRDNSCTPPSHSYYYPGPERESHTTFTIGLGESFDQTTSNPGHFHDENYFPHLIGEGSTSFLAPSTDAADSHGRTVDVEGLPELDFSLYEEGPQGYQPWSVFDRYNGAEAAGALDRSAQFAYNDTFISEEEE